MITLRLDPSRFRLLERLAEAEKRSPADFVESAILRELDAKDEVSRGITMFVPPDAADLVPGSLVRSEGESDERYRQRARLMDKLFVVPDSA